MTSTFRSYLETRYPGDLEMQRVDQTLEAQSHDRPQSTQMQSAGCQSMTWPKAPALAHCNKNCRVQRAKASRSSGRGRGAGRAAVGMAAQQVQPASSSAAWKCPRKLSTRCCSSPRSLQTQNLAMEDRPLPQQTPRSLRSAATGQQPQLGSACPARPVPALQTRRAPWPTASATSRTPRQH